MLIKSTDWTRRGVLKALAAGAALAPFVPTFATEAAPGDLKRLLIFMSGHGLAHYNWKPSGGETTWAMTPILEPLTDLRDQLIVLGDVDHPAAMNVEAIHVKGIKSILTGTTVTGDDRAASISIDQRLATELAGQARFDFLASGVGSDYRGMLATGPAAEVAAETSPAEQFDRLFSDLELDDSALVKLRADRQSVIDVVREDLRAIEGKVATEDKHKIEAHLQVIREIEEDLPSLGSVPGGCTIPPTETQEHSSADAAYVPIAEAHQRILAAALACDLTRVSFLGFASGQALPDMPGVDLPLHDTAHAASKPNKPEVDKARFTAASTWYASQLASMAGQLDTYGILDDTLIVWCTFLRCGHDWFDMPFTLVGGTAAGLGGGRYLQLPGRTSNDLWITVARLMGVELDTFGDPDYCNGPLPGLV